VYICECNLCLFVARRVHRPCVPRRNKKSCFGTAQKPQKWRAFFDFYRKLIQTRRECVYNVLGAFTFISKQLSHPASPRAYARHMASRGSRFVYSVPAHTHTHTGCLPRKTSKNGTRHRDLWVRKREPSSASCNKSWSTRKCEAVLKKTHALCLSLIYTYYGRRDCQSQIRTRSSRLIALYAQSQFSSLSSCLPTADHLICTALFATLLLLQNYNV